MGPKLSEAETEMSGAPLGSPVLRLLVGPLAVPQCPPIAMKLALLVLGELAESLLLPDIVGGDIRQ